MSETTTRTEAIERNPQSGRWFIRMGFAGFNLPQNQVRGYSSAAGAERAHLRCAGRSARALGRG